MKILFVIGIKTVGGIFMKFRLARGPPKAGLAASRYIIIAYTFINMDMKKQNYTTNYSFIFIDIFREVSIFLSIYLYPSTFWFNELNVPLSRLFNVDTIPSLFTSDIIDDKQRERERERERAEPISERPK